MEYLKRKQQQGEITAGTIKNYYRSIKLFCEIQYYQYYQTKELYTSKKKQNIHE